MKPTLSAAALALFLAAAPASAQKAAGQLETAETQPDLAYENAATRKSAVSATDARGGTSRRPSLTFSKTSPKEDAAVPRVGEDRAVTKVPESHWYDSKWAVAGACGILGGLLGFLALGPWGLLGGLVLGAAAGYFLHGSKLGGLLG